MRLAARAVRGREFPPHVRIPLRMLIKILETAPIAADPLAEGRFRLECLRQLQRDIDAARARTYMWPGWMVHRPFNPGSYLSIGARP